MATSSRRIKAKPRLKDTDSNLHNRDTTNNQCRINNTHLKASTAPLLHSKVGVSNPLPASMVHHRQISTVLLPRRASMAPLHHSRAMERPLQASTAHLHQASMARHPQVSTEHHHHSRVMGGRLLPGSTAHLLQDNMALLLHKANMELHLPKGSMVHHPNKAVSVARQHNLRLVTAHSRPLTST